MGRVAKGAEATQAAAASGVAAGAAKRVKVEADAAQKIDVGYYKVAMAGIKYQDQLAAAVTKRAAAEAVATRKAELAAAGPYGRLAMVRRRDLTDEEVAAAAKNKIYDRLNNDRIKAAMKLKGVERDNFAESIANAFGLGAAATGAGLAMLGVGAASAGVKLLAGALLEAKTNALGLAQAGLDFTASVKPLASVMGVAATPEFAQKVADYGVETTLGKDKARDFLEAFRGRSQIASATADMPAAEAAAKNMSAKEYEKFSVKAGKLAAAKGMPAEVAGDLFGSVVKTENFQAKGQGADQAFGRAAGALKILDAGSGKVPELGPQLNKLLATLTSENKLEGAFRNTGEAAVATSVAAEGGSQEAAVLVQRLNDGLRAFHDKDKKEFFKRSGITEKDSFLESMDKAIKVIGEDVAKGTPVDVAVANLGFDKVREVRGMKTFFNARNTVLKPQLENLAKSTSPEGIAGAEAQLKSDLDLPVNVDARDTAEIQSAELKRSGRASDLLHARKAAKTELTGEGLYDTGAGTVKQVIASAFTGFMAKGEDVVLEQRAMNKVRREAGQGQTPEAGIGFALGAALLPGGLQAAAGGMAAGHFQDNASVARHLKQIADNTQPGGGRPGRAPELLDNKPQGGGGSVR